MSAQIIVLPKRPAPPAARAPDYRAIFNPGAYAVFRQHLEAQERAEKAEKLRQIREIMASATPAEKPATDEILKLLRRIDRKLGKMPASQSDAAS